MPRFSLQYHVNGKTDFIPTEAVEAETIEEASAIAVERVTTKAGVSDAIAVTHDQEMVVIPKAQIQYVAVRAVVDRRTARPSVRDFDIDVVSPWDAGNEEAAS